MDQKCGYMRWPRFAETLQLRTDPPYEVQYKILIAGAGLGGLAAASCLLKAGHDVEIYEQAPQLGEIGAGIQVSANAMHVLRHLGVGDAVTKAGVKPGAYVFRLHDTGEVIQQFSLSGRA